VKPFWVFSIVGIAVLAWLARGMILPVFLAMMLAYLLSPLVGWTDALAIRRSVAVGAIFSIIILLAALLGFTIGPRVAAETSLLVERLPETAARVDKALDRAIADLVEAVPVAKNILPAGEGWLSKILVSHPPADPAEFFEHMGHIFILVILVPFFAFFLMRDVPTIITAVMDRLPPQHVETSVAVWRELNGVVGRYVRGVVLDGLVVGALAALGLWALRVPYPLLLGIFAGVANVIPFVGPLLSAAAATLVVLLHAMGLGGVMRVLVLFLVIKVLDDTVIQPLTIGRSVHLHPAILLGSVVVGNHTLGVLGMIVAVPVATIVQETVRLLLEHRRMLARRGLRSDTERLVG
jgi:putative permease